MKIIKIKQKTEKKLEYLKTNHFYQNILKSKFFKEFYDMEPKKVVFLYLNFNKYSA